MQQLNNEKIVNLINFKKIKKKLNERIFLKDLIRKSFILIICFITTYTYLHILANTYNCCKSNYFNKVKLKHFIINVKLH